MKVARRVSRNSRDIVTHRRTVNPIYEVRGTRRRMSRCLSPEFLCLRECQESFHPSCHNDPFRCVRTVIPRLIRNAVDRYRLLVSSILYSCSCSINLSAFVDKLLLLLPGFVRKHKTLVNSTRPNIVFIHFARHLETLHVTTRTSYYSQQRKS